MEPVGRAQEDMVRTQATEFHGLAGWPAQPKLVPTVVVCEYSCCPQHAHSKHSATLQHHHQQPLFSHAQMFKLTVVG